MTWEEISKNLFEKRTAKRFTLHQFGLNFIIRDNGEELSAKQIVDLLNENEQELKNQEDLNTVYTDFIKDKGYTIEDISNWSWEKYE